MGEATEIAIVPKILVIEKGDDNLLMIEKSLESVEVEIVHCESEKQAKKYFKEIKFALIFVDSQSAGFNVYETAKLIRNNKSTKNTPIIFLTITNNNDDNVLRDTYKTGMVDFLFKPIDPAILICKTNLFLTYYLQNRKLSDLTSQLSHAQASLIQSNNELRSLSRKDSVTGLNNRLCFKEILDATLVNTKRYNRILAVLFLDLDNFKSVNDAYGHHIGDELLKKISERLKDAIRKGDFLVHSGNEMSVSRMGGDEFSLVLSEIKQTDNAGEVAQRIIHSISKSISLSNGIDVEIGVSVGIACFPAAGKTSDELCSHADMAMYEAKKTGKNTYQYYSEELNISHRHYRMVEEGLHKALRLKKFNLVYQPIVDLKTGKANGLEVLCRCELDSMKGVPPQEFIEVAEATGLMPELGAWIFSTAVSAAENELFPVNEHLQIHINVSTKQLQDENFLTFIKSVYDKNKVDASNFTVELTETAIVQDTELLETSLNAINKLGSHISIDDFGTGYSSMAWLRDLPVSSLKIDKSFVDGLLTKSNDTVITKSIIRLASNLELLTIAEGIETKEQLNFLIEHECPLGQGYYFSKPLALDKIVAYLKSEK